MYGDDCGCSMSICGLVNVEINGGDSKISREESTSFKLVIRLYAKYQFSLKGFLPSLSSSYL